MDKGKPLNSKENFLKKKKIRCFVNTFLVKNLTPYKLFSSKKYKVHMLNY